MAKSTATFTRMQSRSTSRPIGAVTEPGDLVVDPAAGSFAVMHAARQLGRNFIGCDLIAPPTWRPE